MPAIRNTKKTLVECLLLKQESVKDKSLLERIGMDPTLSTKLYNKLVKADPCWYKVDDLYFSSCPLELYFCKNKTWAKDPQYDSLWKWFNQLQVIIIELDEIGHKLIAKE